LEGESNSAWRRSSRMLRPNPNAAEHLPAPVPFLYSKRHYFAKVARDKRLTAGQKADDALRHALAGVRRNLGLFSQRRMLIALSGVDGSGKTVHAEALKSAFDRCDIRARIVWSRGASSPLTDATIRLGKRLMGGQRSGLASANDVVDRGAALWRRPLVRRVWPWVLAFDLWRQYLGSVAWPLLRGRVVIADRYVADAQAEVAAYLDEAGAPGMPLALRVLERVSPRPAVRFLLDVPPEVAAARKGGEENSDFLQRRATHYRQIAAGPGWRVMDATQPLEDLSSEIVRTVLLRYFHRYRTTFNALFLFNPRAKRPFLEPH
jgi:thymidylate kinase